ncbi:MAG: nucleotidyl transferase AbiEii/AbiGii toxin family protein [Verrucomicrobiales bacterium]|nr:nucleotidyl transferase AbiEii/AbiGii toxin family protein [Verrucomicrobiales bacterium]
MNAPGPVQHVELFHLLLLDQLGRKLDPRHFALKGGCNLRFFLKSIRYSEDMDLDAQTVSPDLLQERVRLILHSKPFGQILKAHGLSVVHWAEPKQTHTTQRWKLSLRADGSAALLPTKLEFSRRGMPDEPRFEPVDPELIRAYRLTPIMASHYPIEIAYQQKVGALAHRALTQARDVFDLYWLISSGAKTELPDNLRPCRPKAQENAMAVTFATFKSQVLAYLATSHREQYDSESVWETLQLTVAEALGSTES